MVKRFLRRVRGAPWRDGVELLGFGCLVATAYLWQPLAGLAALGVALVVIANSGAEERS